MIVHRVRGAMAPDRAAAVRRRAAAPLAVVTGVLVLAAAGWVHHDAPQRAHAAAAVPVVDRGRLPTGTPTRSTPGRRRAVPDSLPTGSVLDYPRFGVLAPIVHVQVVGGAMQIPRDPRTLGWWAGGAVPGADTGSAVLVGHINYAGTTGALAVLPRARPGDLITVDEPAVVVRYRVSAVRTYPKTSGIPPAAFRHGGAASLVLITCGGPFDPSTGNYLDNIVVYAVPA